MFFQIIFLQHTQDVSYVVDDGMSTFGVSRSQESLFDEFLRPTATSTSYTTTATTTSPSSANPPSSSNQLSTQTFPTQDVTDESRIASPPPSNSLTSERSGRLTLGKRSLAGIVISSGPGGHFETYEGTQKSAANRTNQESYTKCDVKTKPTSLLRVNRLATKNPPCPPESNVPTVIMPTNEQPVNETQNVSYPPVVADANWQQQQQSQFPDLTQLTYADMTSFTSFAPLSPMPEFFPQTYGKAVPTTLASKSPDVSSMHELSYSLLRSRPTIVDRREDVYNSVAEDSLGGQGKYLIRNSGG